jgi:gamma-glutamylcyclotransferase (GGCT)/AIG2-like uncharacterized protein YtfP
MCEDIMAAVCDVPVASLIARAASLTEFARHPVINETYPGMVPFPDSVVSGVLYLNLPSSAWPRLDRFEGEMYERQSVTAYLEDGATLSADTYVFRPKFAHRLAVGDWDFAAFLREGKARFTDFYLGFRHI